MVACRRTSARTASIDRRTPRLSRSAAQKTRPPRPDSPPAFARDSENTPAAGWTGLELVVSQGGSTPGPPRLTPRSRTDAAQTFSSWHFLRKPSGEGARQTGEEVRAARGRVRMAPIRSGRDTRLIAGHPVGKRGSGRDVPERTRPGCDPDEVRRYPFAPPLEDHGAARLCCPGSRPGNAQ